ncbi:MAG: hypothetical protein K2M78_06790 [Lachnospiraceae bacterium]|nr:hypothetical protein [Lachnospiraceae bacterium]
MIQRAGTIHNMIQMAELDSRWQQKKDNNLKKQEELTAEERQIQHYQEQLEKMREGNKSSDIYAKIKSGAELTSEEIDYLKKNNPNALREYEDIKREKEAYKNQLKNCRTKEDVEELRVQKMNSFISEARRISSNPYIPEGKKSELMDNIMARVLNIQDAHVEFTKTIKYISLPDDENTHDKVHSKAEAKGREDDYFVNSGMEIESVSVDDTDQYGTVDEERLKRRGIDISV